MTAPMDVDEARRLHAELSPVEFARRRAAEREAIADPLQYGPLEAAELAARLAASRARWNGEAVIQPADILSPDPHALPERKQSLVFNSARDVAAEAPDRPPWIAWPGAVLGALTEVNGRTKAAGKTTFLMHMARAVLDGAPFLGWPTLRTPIVYLSEQAPASLRQALDLAGLTDREDLRILLWRDARGVPWHEIVAAAVAECVRIGARLLIVDTLPPFAGIRGDGENDAGVALEAIEPLMAAAAAGLAVVVARHERKSGGDVADSGRGSSALTGAVDIVIRLGRKADGGRDTIRSLACLSRFGDTPDELLVDLTDTGYVVLGTEAAVAFGEARAAILELLPDDGDGVTEPAIVTAIDGKATTIGQALRHLVDAGDVERTGAGRRGSPYRYRRVAVSLAVDDDDVHRFVSPVPSGRAGREKAIRAPAGMSVSDEMGMIFDQGAEA